MFKRFSQWFFGIDGAQKKRHPIKEIHLEKGRIKIIVMPDLGYDKEYKITKWHVQPGQLIKTGDVVCDIESRAILMEFESFYGGRVLPIVELNQKLEVGDAIFKIEGV